MVLERFRGGESKAKKDQVRETAEDDWEIYGFTRQLHNMEEGGRKCNGWSRMDDTRIACRVD
jgi:hypothetical protein